MYIRVNETIQTHDLAATLKGERGSFLAERAGQSYLVIAQEGHSISSMRPVGVPQAVTLQAGVNPAFNLTKLSDAILEEGERREWRGERETTGTRN